MGVWANHRMASASGAKSKGKGGLAGGHQKKKTGAAGMGSSGELGDALAKPLKPGQVKAAIGYNRRRLGERITPAQLKALQTKLGVDPTGKFDEPTIQAVARFQASHHLSMDGKIGPRTEGVMPIPKVEPKAGTKPAAQTPDGTSEGASGGTAAGVAGAGAKAGAEGAPKKPRKTVAPPTRIDRKTVIKYFNEAFDAQFKDAGLFHAVFKVRLQKFKKLRHKPGAFKSYKDIASVWNDFSAKLSGWSKDIRLYRPTLVLEASSPKGKPVYYKITISLRRDAVTLKQAAKIEKGLVNVDSSYTYGGRRIKVSPEVYESYKKLYAAAKAAGLTAKVPQLFKIVSGYRSVKHQQRIYANKVASLKAKHPNWSDRQIERQARKWVAKPGTSAHNTGHAIDLYMGWGLSSSNANKMQRKSSKLYKRYGKYWEWLKENAPKYGFLPYSREPWHWEKWK